MPLASFGAVNYAILMTYLTGMVIIGILLGKKQKSSDDYFLAGRNMPWLIVGMSMFASLTSATTFIGVPALAYGQNVSIIMGVAVSPLVAIVLVKLIYPIYWKYKVTTSYEFIAIRFGKPARYSVSMLFILARLGWLGIVIYAPAFAISKATGINLKLAIVLMGFLATVYTVTGGLAAVLWTDMVQFIILSVGAIWIACSLVNLQGGFVDVFSTVGVSDKLDIFKWDIDLTQMTAAAAMLSFFFSFMQDYGTDQVSVQRLISVKNYKGLTKAISFNAVTDILMNALLLFIGIGLFAYYSKTHGVTATSDGKLALMTFIMENMPNGVSGLIITAIFAAAMSSMDSGINSISTVIVNDYASQFSKRISQNDALKVKLGRVSTLIIGVFATFVAFYIAMTENDIVKAWGTFMGMFSAPILAIFLLGMLTKRGNFVGWLLGTTFAICVNVYLQKTTDIHWIYYFPMSFGISFTTGYLLSLSVKVIGLDFTKKDAVV